MIAKAHYFAFERNVFDPVELGSAGPWDYFLSAYDATERVSIPFEEINAEIKQWVVHEEYRVDENQMPDRAMELSASDDPPDVFDFVKDMSETLRDAKFCIDATGFVRPHFLMLLRALYENNLRSFDVIYSDPNRYIEGERTAFTGPILEVKQVPGYEGFHRHSSTPNDRLVIGAGYDHDQIARVCEEKLRSEKFLMIGLPSLQPHMYQESILRINKANEWIGTKWQQNRLFASANHPFAAAQALRDLVVNESMRTSSDLSVPANWYFCPIGPKPHVLGFAIFYLRELIDTAASIIYPFAESYPTSTSQGLLRTWQYRIEL